MILTLLKVLMLTATFYIIYIEVFQERIFLHAISFATKALDLNSLTFILIALLLSYANWFSESIKWRKLISFTTPVSKTQAFKATLAGTAISLFTPNRVGGFLGRILFIPPQWRISGAILSVFGNISQLIVTLWFGLSALTYMLWIKGELAYAIMVGTVSILFIPLSYFAFTTNSFTITLFKSNKWLWNKFKRQLSIFRKLDTHTLRQVILISIVRYLVFTSQFMLLLYAFKIQLRVIDCFAGIGLTYFLMTVIPSITLAEFGVREIIAIELMGQNANNDLIIFYASFTLWLFNLILPALVGNYFLVRLTPSKI